MNIAGKYSNYDLLTDGISIDFTIDEFKNNHKEIFNFFQDQNIRCKYF